MSEGDTQGYRHTLLRVWKSRRWRDGGMKRRNSGATQAASRPKRKVYLLPSLPLQRNCATPLIYTAPGFLPGIPGCVAAKPPHAAISAPFASSAGGFLLSYDSAGKHVLPALMAATPDFGLTTDAGSRGIGHAMVESDGAKCGPNPKTRRW